MVKVIILKVTLTIMILALNFQTLAAQSSRDSIVLNLGMVSHYSEYSYDGGKFFYPQIEYIKRIYTTGENKFDLLAGAYIGTWGHSFNIEVDENLYKYRGWIAGIRLYPRPERDDLFASPWLGLGFHYTKEEYLWDSIEERREYGPLLELGMNIYLTNSNSLKTRVGGFVVDGTNLIFNQQDFYSFTQVGFNASLMFKLGE